LKIQKTIAKILEKIAKLSKSQNWPNVFFLKKNPASIYGKTPNPFVAFFFLPHDRGKKKYMPMRANNFLYHMSKGELSSMSSFSSTNSPKT
jgi:hypothetical protein